jgi:hypothetical protein
MSVSDVRDSPKRKKRSTQDAARRNAVKDALPDRQLPGRTKQVLEDEPVAENDEEDD